MNPAEIPERSSGAPKLQSFVKPPRNIKFPPVQNHRKKIHAGGIQFIFRFKCDLSPGFSEFNN
jgi:hypothetical protein